MTILEDISTAFLSTCQFANHVITNIHTLFYCVYTANYCQDYVINMTNSNSMLIVNESYSPLVADIAAFWKIFQQDYSTVVSHFNSIIKLK